MCVACASVADPNSNINTPNTKLTGSRYLKRKLFGISVEFGGKQRYNENRYFPFLFLTKGGIAGYHKYGFQSYAGQFRLIQNMILKLVYIGSACTFGY
jgi:hypothetical protein